MMSVILHSYQTGLPAFPGELKATVVCSEFVAQRAPYIVASVKLMSISGDKAPAYSSFAHIVGGCVIAEPRQVLMLKSVRGTLKKKTLLSTRILNLARNTCIVGPPVVSTLPEAGAVRS